MQKWIVLYGLAGLLGSAFAQKATVTLHLDKPQWVVSKYLTGSHFVYAYEADWIYEDDAVVDWMKRAKVGFIRYPGGTATMNWHWDDLNGYAFDHHVQQLTGETATADTWSPDYRSLPKRNPKEYMDVDEYMAVCRRVGAEAMLGINIRSGDAYRSGEDSKAEARRLAEYCKAKGYDVKFFYIGNEGYTCGFHGQKYASAIDEYAAILKKAYPDAQIIADWKYGPREKKRFEQSMELVRMSKSIDIMEYHEKWGNDWGLYSGLTREDWMAQKPFLYNGQFTGFYERFERNNRELGRDVKHAHNEWGLGGMKGSEDAHDFALLTADFFIELFRHPTYMASGWNLNMGPKPARVFLAENGRVRLMPPSLVYEMVATAMGSRHIPIESEGNPAVYGFATKDEKTQWTQVYLMNKSDLPAVVTLDPKGGHLAIDAMERLVAPGRVTVEKFASAPATITLHPMSFSRLAGAASGSVTKSTEGGVEIGRTKGHLIDGKDISSVLLNHGKSPHEAFFYHRGNELQAVRSGKWKLHVKNGKPIQLYDMETDIGEKKNVLADHPEVAKRLRSHAVTFQEELRRSSRPAGMVENPKLLTK